MLRSARSSASRLSSCGTSCSSSRGLEPWGDCQVNTAARCLNLQINPTFFFGSVWDAQKRQHKQAKVLFSGRAACPRGACFHPQLDLKWRRVDGNRIPWSEKTYRAAIWNDYLLFDVMTLGIMYKIIKTQCQGVEHFQAFYVVSATETADAWDECQHNINKLFVALKTLFSAGII